MNYHLSAGKHETADQGRCAMEWVAYIAGEPHSDSPRCVDPVLRRFSIGLNDNMDDETRQRLRPYLARMIGTAGDGRTQERAFMVVDWAVRLVAPVAFEACGLAERAELLRALPRIVNAETAKYAANAAAVAAVAANAAANAAAAYATYAAAATEAAYVAAYATYATEAAAAAAAEAAAAATTEAAAELVWGSALVLIDQMLPKEWIELPEPITTRAREVCAA